MLISSIKFFIQPFNIFGILLLLAVVGVLLKRRRLSRWLILVTGIWFLMISTPFLPNLLINSLEDRYEPVRVNNLEDPGAEYYIVVLGGGHGYDDRLPSNALLSLNALGRLNEAIRLFKQLPNSNLVLSGYSSSHPPTQAEILQKTAILLGISEKATMIQKEPGNTYEEAEDYAKNYGHSHPVILVTSATHMPRAMWAFRHFGIEPIPSPTNYRLKGSWKRKWLGVPSMSNIENLGVGVYEYAGIYWYRFTK